MVKISEDLRDLISSTINSIKEGLKEEKCGVSGTIKYEVSAAKSKKAKTGFKVLVADASGDYTKDNTSKISFEIEGVLSESEKTALNNKISKLQINLSSSHSENGQLKNEIQSLNSTVTKQQGKIKEKDEEIKKLGNLNNQLVNKIANIERQLERARQEIGAQSNINKRLKDELAKNPRTIVN
ncbi:MAG: hypothetical protein NUK63_07880 [Candidatus Bathyarchaeum tardum]|nr:MAG: hypothetical protein NUK63_07880 [Candidatus Bathyarchaeum tardum]